MIIGERFRRCAVFLYIDRESKAVPGYIERAPVGTAFGVLMSIDKEKPGMGYAYYWVTASHVVQRSTQYGALFLRFNLKDGTYKDVPTDPTKDWIPSPSKAADVSLNMVTQRPEGADNMLIPFELLMSDEMLAEQGISAGEDLFSVGLFSPYPGEGKNEPIVRFGNIALMPRLVPTQLLGPQSAPVYIEGYLTEWRSWGGSSGSPVFWYAPPDRHPNEIRIGNPTIRLLGIVHGHINIREEVEFTGDILGSGNVKVNSGVAVVLPARQVIELLMLPEVAEERNALALQVKQALASAVTPDDADSKEENSPTPPS